MTDARPAVNPNLSLWSNYMLNRALVAVAITFAAASAHAGDVLLSEEFNNVAALPSGWVQSNLSSPAGSTSWFQGDQTIFGAQSGSPEAYIAANFNNAEPGGTINNWLITPTFSTESGVTISFWAKGANDPGFADHLSFGISNGSGIDPAAFSLVSSFTAQGDWTQYTVNYAAQGAGSVARIGINYSGAADLSNYIGVDTLTVTALPVPEPSTWALMGLGLMGLGIVKRRAGAPR